MNRDQISAVSDAIGIANQRVVTDLLNAKRTRVIKCKFRVGVNITVAGTGIRNRGSALALLSAVGLDQAGTDKLNIDGRIARFFSEIHAPSALPATRLAAAGVQNVTLEETFYLFLSSPRSAVPQETAFIEENIQNKLSAFLEYNADATRIVIGGTVALSNPTLRVEQMYDEQRVPGVEPPYLLPFARQIVQDVPGANDSLRIDLRGSRYLAALVIQQDTATGGEVEDIINSLVLRGDGREIIGPRAVPWADLVDHQAEMFGGSVTGTKAYFCYHFLQDGKLSKLLHPASYTNLRFEVNCQPSVVAGAGASRIRVAMFEYEPKPGLTAPIPFDI